MAKAPSSLLAFFKNEYNKIDEVGEIDSKKVYSSEDYVELVKLDDQIAKNNIEKTSWTEWFGRSRVRSRRHATAYATRPLSSQ